VILLQVATGKLTRELTGSSQLGYFTVVTWLDNKRVYVLGPPPQPSPIERLSLLDITKNRDIHGADLQTVTDLLILDTFWSLDSSFDSTKLFLGECQTPENSPGSFSNIFVEPPNCI
jgi:hypothetical protein